MAQQTIGLGATANDGNGDDLRTAGGKINANFTEVYDKQDKPAEGAFEDGDKTKLDGIEASATADQTAAEIAAMSQDWRGTGAETLIQATAALQAAGASGGDAWGDAVDADIVPDADGTRDLGSTSNRFAELHVDAIDLGGTSLTATELSDPGADRILFWDDSAGEMAFLTAGSGLDITGTTITATIESDPTGVTGADQVTNVMSLTTAEYGAITPDASTLYLITDAT